jgi:hypothetical protein
MTSSHLIVAAAHNTPGINPASGLTWKDGNEFLLEADAYRAFVTGAARGVSDNRVRRIDNRVSRALRFKELRSYLPVHPLDARGNPVRYASVAFFCHGTQFGIQLGAGVDSVRELARGLNRVCQKEPTVALYACSTGGDNDDVDDERSKGPGGDGGFADALRDCMVALGMRPTVYAHTTKGHCTRNPHVRRFGPDDDFGGQWIVEPGSELWSDWCKWLRLGINRFAFTQMSIDQIHAALRAA